MRLHRFFSHVEREPQLTLPSAHLESALGGEAARALCAHRVLVPAGHATWFPCARQLRTCRRSTALDGALLHLLCGRGEGECPTETLPAESCGQHALDDGALVTLIRELVGATKGVARAEGRGDPWWLGRMEDRDTEAWLWLRPREVILSEWVEALHQRHPRPRQRLVLVPTPRNVRFDTFERYGPGNPIELRFLERILDIEGDRIVSASVLAEGRPRLPRNSSSARPSPFAVPRGVRWAHITVEYVEDDVLAIRVGAKAPQRATAAELGLAHPQTKRPSDLWTLLQALCVDNGTTTLPAVGAPNLGALRVQATRLSDRLCTLFGITETPLHVEAKTLTVRSDFIARPEPLRNARRREREGRP